MSGRGHPPGPDQREGFDELRRELRGILFDAVIVGFFAVVIHLLSLYIQSLDPPGGPVFLARTRFEFPAQWMVDIMHIANFAVFILRTTWHRLLRGGRS